MLKLVVKYHLIVIGTLLLSLSVGACAPSATPPEVVRAPDDGTLLAAAYDPGSGRFLKASGRNGVYRASDKADAWSPLPVRGPLNGEGLTRVAVSLEDPNMVAASGPGVGVLLTRDGGQQWAEANSGLPSKQVRAVATHTNRPGTLFAAIEGKGLFRTENGGEKWERMDGGPEVSRIDALVHSTLPGSMNTGWLYATSPEGVYISMDCF